MGPYLVFGQLQGGAMGSHISLIQSLGSDNAGFRRVSRVLDLLLILLGAVLGLLLLPGSAE